MTKPASTDTQSNKPAMKQDIAELEAGLKGAMEALETRVYKLDTSLVSLEERVDMLEVRMNLRFDEIRSFIVEGKEREQRAGELDRLETLVVDLNRQVKTLIQASGMTPSRRRNATSAYEPLRHHLSNLDGAAVTLSFWEVQKILNRSLPRSAFTTQAWWSNERTHTHARYGWLAAGWRVTSVNMNGLSVTFESGPV